MKFLFKRNRRSAQQSQTNITQVSKTPVIGTASPKTIACISSSQELVDQFLVLGVRVLVQLLQPALAVVDVVVAHGELLAVFIVQPRLELEPELPARVLVLRTRERKL